MLVLPAFCVGLACFLCAACTEPIPLYGTWSDNRGNTFSFFEDGTFNAKFSGDNVGGNYSVLLNALTLSTNNGQRIVTEWDIRGNMLYLDWTDEDGKPISMTLYKVSN